LALVLFFIEGQSVQGHLLTPERLVGIGSVMLQPRVPALPLFMVTQCSRYCTNPPVSQRRRKPWTSAESDRAFGESAVGVKYRIMRVLPTLLNQTIRGGEPRILHESIPAPSRSPKLSIPIERQLNVPPDKTDQRAVACTFEVSGPARTKNKGVASHCHITGETGLPQFAPSLPHESREESFTALNLSPLQFR